MAKKLNNHGISIIIHSEIGAKHKKPHVHAKYCEYEAALDLNGNVLAGILPPKKLKATRQWIKANQQNLYNEWYKKNPDNTSRPS